MVYRDGVGGPTFRQKLLDIELQTMIDSMKAYEAGYDPKIIYVFVDKRISTRFFAAEGQDIVNPAPGTVVDYGLVEETNENMYDFYLIPHKATIATALPVHFRVEYNSTGWTKSQVETYTYWWCYNYFNYMGSIKVPASVMCAHKSANFAHEN